MQQVLASLIVVLLSSVSAHARTIRLSYPFTFLWGAAFSAHQTEGIADGGENSDWYPFEHPKLLHSPITDGDTADVAVDFWHRYGEDLQNAKDLGLNTLRTSVAWEKIEPKQGEFNADAMAHYRAIFLEMKEMGLRPMICLNHFTSPKWFDDEGGWTNSKSPQMFLEYAQYVVSHLSDVTNLWITFNEPMILVEEGYLQAQTPPLRFGIHDGFEAAWNLARAHRMVTVYIHQIQPRVIPAALDPEGVSGVGLAYAFGFFDPADPKSSADIQAAENLTELSDWDWLNAVETGHLEFRLKVPGLADKVFARDLPASDIPATPLRGQDGTGRPGPMFDWLGVNYYQRYMIKHKKSIIPFEWITPPGPQGDNGWSIYPEGLERLLRAVAQRYHYPLIVTENGIADDKDTRRPQFIKDHLHYLDNAILGNGKSGSALNIRGYYHWSLMDNFEWLSGYSYKFGLYQIQFDNDLKRVARPSAAVYAQEIQKRRAPLWYITRKLE